METPARNKTYKSHKPNEYKFEKFIFEMPQNTVVYFYDLFYIMLHVDN